MKMFTFSSIVASFILPFLMQITLWNSEMVRCPIYPAQFGASTMKVNAWSANIKIRSGKYKADVLKN